MCRSWGLGGWASGCCGPSLVAAWPKGQVWPDCYLPGLGGCWFGEPSEEPAQAQQAGKEFAQCFAVGDQYAGDEGSDEVAHEHGGAVFAVVVVAFAEVFAVGDESIGPVSGAVAVYGAWCGAGGDGQDAVHPDLGTGHVDDGGYE